jgi:cell division protein FtsZ
MSGIDDRELRPRLTVLAVGGAGGNALDNMIRSGLDGVDFIACNTDAQALGKSLAKTRIQLGLKVTQGLGAGSRPEMGRSAAEESLDEVMSHLKTTNMLFITAGMGGGTGTGGAPVLAKAAREAGILTVGVVTKPFQFEGAHRARSADRGIEEMHQCVDTLLVIPNQNLFRLANEHTTFADAFAMADDVLYSGVRTFTDLMIKHGLINLDFADICSVMREMMGKAMMGTGQAMGERRAIEAAEQAISCPLLDNDVSMRGARAVLINISGGLDMTLFEVDEAANRIREEVDANANIIFGATFDESVEGLRVSVVATGIDAKDGANAPVSPEGTFTTTPRSVFRLNASGRPFLDEEMGHASQSEFGGPLDLEGDSVDDRLKQTGDQPLGRRHDLFSMSYEDEHTDRSRLPGDRDLSSDAASRQYDSTESPASPPSKDFSPLETPPPPKKRSAMTFLERLGVSRKPVQTPERPSSSGMELDKEKQREDYLASPASRPSPDSPDSLDMPAFMRQQRRRP